ncbi:biotin carboxylase [Salipaludibacillus keqinensis]|uniref:Biotin carboxylase n=1 Tax=Salipaludibacillus keqinensis TaxID=2045207 RepID=A0A323TMY9_9BACI|nr:biotin carboxylase N-terminal domain-containing protein [Salipaludibacillus keqinensis]PYZ94083.1 biotin carboxylase [Salipaludibacillus keqinensis]
MIKKILIANRGEIACRIIKTCEKLGIQSVAIYSEADQYSMHVELASESYLVGGARVNESYLNQDNILNIAKKSGADAIHPGYGFLSEHAGFARRVIEEGMVFIGPTPEAIEQMGDKVQSREVMKQANVPVVPGVTLTDIEENTVIKACREIGFPIMVKAASGGGGIGMQKVDHEDEVMRAVQSVVKKSETFFGSSQIFLEKYIEKPRHIEAQIAGDDHGNIISLGSRDCSIQRRHQKIIEEAPAPHFSEQANHQLLNEAVKAGEALGYTNVGTVEFLVDDKENIYFLEMNTRLQVEHPVTEETTGIDLVEWQIRLSEKQMISTLNRRESKAVHAIEVRIYAEDPKTFFPSPGTISEWIFPEMEGIRYDFGVRSGTVVTPYYDPMIGKVIAYAGSRGACIELMNKCLSNATVEGIKTNIPMLLKSLEDHRFKEGNVTTHFVQQL